MFLNLQMTSNSIFKQFSAWKVLFGIKDEIFQKIGPCKPIYQLFRVFSVCEVFHGQEAICKAETKYSS